MNITAIEIETLNLQQLVKRSGWENYSLDNIIQLAQNGYFGLYFNIHEITGTHKMKTYRYVQECVDFLVKHPNNSEESQKLYNSLDEKLKIFMQEKPYLLEHYDGAARLAIQVETEILKAMFYCTVDKFRRDLQLKGHKDDNDYFGFQIVNGRLVAPAYWFPNRIITSDNLFVRLRQIENFEKCREAQLSSAKNIENIIPPKMNSIILNGESFEITFEGKRLPNIQELVGLHILKTLLQAPHKTFSVEDLHFKCNPTVVGSIISDEELYGGGFNISRNINTPVMPFDAKTKKDVEEAIEKITEDLDIAIEIGDREKKEKLQEDQKLLQGYLSVAAPTKTGPLI